MAANTLSINNANLTPIALETIAALQKDDNAEINEDKQAIREAVMFIISIDMSIENLEKRNNILQGLSLIECHIESFRYEKDKIAKDD